MEAVFLFSFRWWSVNFVDVVVRNKSKTGMEQYLVDFWNDHVGTVEPRGHRFHTVFGILQELVFHATDPNVPNDEMRTYPEWLNNDENVLRVDPTTLQQNWSLWFRGYNVRINRLTHRLLVPATMVYAFPDMFSRSRSIRRIPTEGQFILEDRMMAMRDNGTALTPDELMRGILGVARAMAPSVSTWYRDDTNLSNFPLVRAYLGQIGTVWQQFRKRASEWMITDDPNGHNRLNNLRVQVQQLEEHNQQCTMRTEELEQWRRTLEQQYNAEKQE